MRIDKILLPTDFSECSLAALDYALFLVETHGAELSLFHVVELHVGARQTEGADFPSFDEIGERLDAIGDRGLGREIAARTESVRRLRKVERRAVAAAPAIVEYAEEEGIDLIVIGTHGHRGVRRLLLGSVTEEVLRTADCPVITVRDEAASRGLRALDRILVPFDFSPDAMRSLGVARTLAESYGSCIDLVHVTHVMAPLVGPGVEAASTQSSFPESKRELETHLAQIAAEPVAGRAASDQARSCVIDSHVLVGPIAASLVDFASRQDSSLLVIATHGLSGVRRLLMGSVTEQVVRSAPCPVLVLRHVDDREAASAGEASEGR